jgi:DNA helicase-2/ATP-dependent DNA helicase PcrA
VRVGAGSGWRVRRQRNRAVGPEREPGPGAGHRIVGTVAPDDLLQDLDEAQRRAVTSPGRPLAILAPAGSGKTRVLTRRIAWRVASEDAEAHHVLALTFTRKAASELRSRLAGLGLRDGVAAGTFHSIAYAQIRGYWADRGHKPLALLARKAKILGEVLRQAGSRTARGSPTARDLAGEIEWAKARLFGPDRYAEGTAAAGRRSPGDPAEIAELYGRYEELKRRQGLADFDDLLKLCSDALAHDTDFAAAQRWRYRHLFVDEFQDVNPLQLGLLDAWRGTHYDMCVVGDPQQAIYGWNGADARLLLRFREMYPSAEIVSLEHNYRSTPQILAAASHVLQRARLDTAAVRVTQADGPAPRLVRYPTDVEEARAVARAVRDRRAPRTPWSAQAVLVRTHAQIALVTEGLRAGGIPYRVRGGAALLEDKAVRSALEMLRRDAGRPLSMCLPDLEALADDTWPGDPGDEDEVSEGSRTTPEPLETLLQLARDHLRVDDQATAAGFSAWLAATLQAEGVDAPGRDAVTVATFHAAKGLEWPVVHLAGLEDGFVPIGHARTTAQRAEEARLLYVAMTRALVDLCCTWAAQRTFNAKVVDRRACPWLRDLPDDGKGPGPGPVTGSNQPRLDGMDAEEPDWRTKLAEQRARLHGSRRPVPPELQALLTWREEAARRARIDPTAVLDDQLLEAVAARRPANHDELAAIPGVGRLLAERVGEGLLTALRAAAEDR